MARNITISSVAASVTGSLITTQGGNAPGTPSITSPAANTGLSSYTPTYSASTFFNYVAGTHSGTNWQLATDANFTSIIYDLATTSNLTSFTVPANIITANMSDVYVRARYINSSGIMSSFSAGQRNICTPGVVSATGLVVGSNVNFTVTYANGIGTITTATVGIASNIDNTSPVVSSARSFTNNIATFSVALSTLPGFDTLATTYYVRVTVTSGQVPATSVGVGSSVTISSGKEFTSGSGSGGTTPASQRNINVVVVAGGGGGGAAPGSGGGGGGGGITIQTINNVAANSAINYAIGTGGGGSGWGAAAGTGGTTTVNIAGTTYSAAGGQGGTDGQRGLGVGGGGNGGSPQQDGQASAYGAGGIKGSYGNSTGGQGGKGYGAGGGGNTRDGGDGPGGGGGGGYGTGQFATAGNFTNVGNGGTGAGGYIIITYA